MNAQVDTFVGRYTDALGRSTTRVLEALRRKLSRPSGRSAAVLAEEVEQAVTDKEETMSAATAVAQATTTVRCRLYQSRHELRHGSKYVMQVWDSLDNPLDDLPWEDRAELKGEFTHESLPKVREQVRTALAHLGHPPTGSWRQDRGSI